MKEAFVLFSEKRKDKKGTQQWNSYTTIPKNPTHLLIISQDHNKQQQSYPLAKN